MAGPSWRCGPVARAETNATSQATRRHAVIADPPPPPSSVESAAPSTWADYHRLSAVFWSLLLLGLAGTLAVAALFLVERHGIHGLLWPMLAWLAAVAYAGYHLQAFRCPRCQRRFFRSHPPLLALRARRCVNCMLPKE
jgi:hypothetical protein